jgi:hypothetical protein
VLFSECFYYGIYVVVIPELQCYSLNFVHPPGVFHYLIIFVIPPNVVVYLLSVSVIRWKFMLFANGKCYSPVVVLLWIFMSVFEFLCYSLKFLPSLNVYVIFRQVNRMAQQWCVWLTYGKPLQTPATQPQDFRSFNIFFFLSEYLDSILRNHDCVLQHSPYPSTYHISCDTTWYKLPQYKVIQ